MRPQPHSNATLLPVHQPLSVSHQTQGRHNQSPSVTNHPSTALKLARPQLTKRSDSGRYTYRLRTVGSVKSIVEVSLRTQLKGEAVKRYNHLSSTLKAFMLDKPEATPEELSAHLNVVVN